MDFILMSIRSKYVRKMFAGTKVWEFRRNLPRAAESLCPPRVLIYSSGEDRALVGSFEIAEVMRAPLDALLQHTGYADDPEAREWFIQYYRKQAVCGAIKVGRLKRFAHPLSIDVIRTHLPGFTPPQTFLYAKSDHPLIKFMRRYDRTLI